MQGKPKAYVATSRKNPYCEEVIKKLDQAGFEILDWRKEGACFSWSDVYPNWESWSPQDYLRNLNHEQAVIGFNRVLELMKDAELAVLLWPSGKSAHLEAGRFVGKGTPTIAVVDGKAGPELMLKMCDKIITREDDLVYDALHLLEDKLVEEHTQEEEEDHGFNLQECDLPPIKKEDLGEEEAGLGEEAGLA